MYGLWLCAVGDFALALVHHPTLGGEPIFHTGVISFHIAHIFFIFGFKRRAELIKLHCKLEESKQQIAFYTAIISITMSIVIVHSVVNTLEAVAGVLYVVIISSMCYFALIISDLES